MTICSIDRCEKPSRTRGWCGMHYQRWKAHGDPLGGNERFATPEDAFLARTEPLLWSGCVVWTGSTASNGYGQMWSAGRLVQAHRWAWEQEHGGIPEGMLIDHTCWERSCVNVDHLRLATPAQNTANRRGPTRTSVTGVRGVYRKDGGYRVRVKHLGKLHNFGTFPTIEEASAVASAKRKELFGEFAGAA